MIKIIKEIELKDFEFWQGGKDTAKHLTENDFTIVETYLNEFYPDGATNGQINDFFWFEDDSIADLLGYEDWDDLLERREQEAKAAILENNNKDFWEIFNAAKARGII